MPKVTGSALRRLRSSTRRASARADTIWGARTEYLLRREGETLRMARKKVMLSNNDKPLYTLSFLV